MVDLGFFCSIVDSNRAGWYNLDRELGGVTCVFSWRRAPLSREELPAVACTAGFWNEGVLCWLPFSPIPGTAFLSTLKAVAHEEKPHVLLVLSNSSFSCLGSFVKTEPEPCQIFTSSTCGQTCLALCCLTDRIAQLATSSGKQTLNLLFSLSLPLPYSLLFFSLPFFSSHLLCLSVCLSKTELMSSCVLRMDSTNLRPSQGFRFLITAISLQHLDSRALSA